MKGTIVTIDSNEHSHHPEHKKTLESMGAMCQVKSLPYDFEVICPDGSVLKIERKTPRDFLDSIRDRRLFNQATSLVDGYGYVVVEGYFRPNQKGMVIYGDTNAFNDELTNWTWNSLQGSLISLQEAGIAIVYNSDFYEALSQLVSRSRNDIKVAPRREMIQFSPDETLYMAFTGIGSDKAAKLAVEFDKAGKGIEFLTTFQAMPKIDGIGDKTKENIIKQIGGSLYFAEEEKSNE